MLTPEVVGRYRQYKRGQRKLVCWLVETGGQRADLQTIIKAFAESPVRKGKPQSGKKGRGKNGKARGSRTVQESEVELKSCELVGLAEAVAKANPPVSIPDYVLATVEDVVRGREECRDWYAAHPVGEKSDVEDKNKSHGYFIDVLQKVRKLLHHAQSRAPPAAASTRAQHTGQHQKSRPDGDGPSINTLFEWLSVEEPGENALADEAPPVHITTSTGEARVKVSLKQEYDDAVFQTFCFLQDLNDVRRFVVETWQGYARGELSFVNASVVTDTAFGLLRRTDEDFEASSPMRSTDWQRLLKYLGISYVVGDNAVCLSFDTDRTTDTPFETQSIAHIMELLCPQAFYCLDHYRTASNKFCQAETHTFKNPGTEAICTFPEAPVVHDMCYWLWEMVTEIHMEAHVALDRSFIYDEFVQGLSDIHRTSKIRMWIVIACQINMAIGDILGEHASHGVELMRGFSSYHYALKADMDIYAGQSLFSIEDVAIGLRNMCIGIEAADKMNSRAQMPRRPMTGQPIPVVEKKTLLATESYREDLFPASAGLFLLDDKLNSFKDACDIVPHGGFVMLMAHLYSAFRAMGALGDTLWPDMDFMLDAFGQSRPLVAPKDKAYDAARARRRLALDFGLRAEAFAKDFRSLPKGRAFSKGLRNLSLTSPFLRAFHDTGLLNTLRYKMPYARVNSVEAMLRTLLDGEEGKASGKKSSTKQKSTGAQSKTRFTPVALLELMSAKLRVEEPGLNFDFVRFTLSCSRLMQALLTLYHDGVPPKLAHQQATYTELSFELMSLPRSSEAVREATNMLAEHIREEGSVFLDKARGLSSGTLSEENKPQISAESSKATGFEKR